MRAGDWGWVRVWTEILVHEVSAPPGELLSEATDRYRARRPWLTDLVIVYVALHLLRRWPKRIDPLTRLAGLRR